METFVTVVHVLIALVLIALVLVQDTKSGSLGGAFGGGGSNSILGATGATTLAAKATRWAGVLFAITCISLTYFSSRKHQSVVDGFVPAAPVEAAAPAVPTTPDATAPAAAPAATPAPEKK